MLFRLALAAFVGLSACSDDGSKATNSGSGDPNGSGGTLRQAASLSGPIANQIRIVGDGWEATSAGQTVTLVFELDGIDVAQLRQLEINITPEPASAFDLASASFTAESPPFLVPPFLPQGVQQEEGYLRMAWAILGEPQRPLQSTETVGTFTIKTSSTFNTFTDARLTVSRLSVGPSSSERDVYDRTALKLGVDVN